MDLQRRERASADSGDSPRELSAALLLPAVRAVRRPVVSPRGGRRLRAAASLDPDDPGRPPLRRRIVRRTVRALVVVALVGVVSVVWVGVRGAMAVNTLLGATPAFNDVIAAVSVAPSPTVIASVDEIKTAVHRAHGLVDDPVWSALQHLPVLGDRLVSVRSALAAADILAADGLGPVVALSQTVTFGPYPNGGAGFASLVQASELEDDVAGIAAAIVRARAELDGVTTDLILPMLSDPFADAVATVDQAGDVAASLVPGVDGMLELTGYRAPTTTIVAVLDPSSARPLGGRVERLFLMTVDDGSVGDFLPVDPAAALAAAVASESFTLSAAGPQAPLLVGRQADVSQLASTPDAAAALRAGVAAVTGIDARAVVLLSTGGIDSLRRDLSADGAAPVSADGAAPVAGPLTAALRDALPEQRAGLIDPAAEEVVRLVVGLTPRADRTALAIRDVVVGGELRVWFADPRVQDPLARMRGAGALPATTGQGIPVTVTLDTGGAPAALTATGLRVSAGTCGALWAAHPSLNLDLTLAPTGPAPDPAVASSPRVLVGVPADAEVRSVTDAAGQPLAHSEVALTGQRLLVVDTSASTTQVRVSVAGRTDQTGGLTAVSRGGVPAAGAGVFSCR